MRSDSSDGTTISACPFGLVTHATVFQSAFRTAGLGDVMTFKPDLFFFQVSGDDQRNLGGA